VTKKIYIYMIIIFIAKTATYNIKTIRYTSI